MFLRFTDSGMPKNKPGRQSEDDRPPGGIFRIGSVGLCRDSCPVNYAKQENVWDTASYPATPEIFILLLLATRHTRAQLSWVKACDKIFLYGSPHRDNGHIASIPKSP